MKHKEIVQGLFDENLKIRQENFEIQLKAQQKQLEDKDMQILKLQNMVDVLQKHLSDAYNNGHRTQATWF